MCQLMVSQHHILDMLLNIIANVNIIANINIIRNIPTNLSKICTAPLLILTITLPANNPLANIRFNLLTNLPTILLPTHLPLTSQWDNLAMNITLTNLQFGTNPLTDLQFNLPTNISAVFLHTHHCMWDNLASNMADLPITNSPTPYPSHLPFTPPTNQHVSTRLPLTNLLSNLSMYIHLPTNLLTILPTHLLCTSQWDNIAIK